MANLTFKSNGATKVALIKVGSPAQISLQYSKDGTNWSNYTVGEEIPLSNNQFVSFSGANEKFNLTNAHYYNFSAEGEGTLSLSGDLMSLISGENVDYPYTFCKLFLGNDKIVDASQFTLSASNIFKWCYANMFKDCTNLSAAPSALPAETLKEWCYQGMFAGCGNLRTAPILPATTLAKYCYYAMFYNCTNLSTPPYLPAETLTDWCYNSMFFNCQKLTYISANFTNWTSNATSSWLYNTSSNGVFICPSSLNTSVSSCHRNPQNWQVWAPQTMPITFKALSSSSNVSITNTCGGAPTGAFKYMKNYSGIWEDPTYGTFNYMDRISFNSGEVVSFSGANSNPDGNRFALSGGNVSVFGSVLSLKSNPNRAYMDASNLFVRNSNLYDASELYFGTTLTASKCCRTFLSCTNLVYPPKLPFTKLWNKCYAGMFGSCSSLLSAPELPATELANGCYDSMFGNCTSLTAAPYLSATVSAPSCYYSMFSNCTNLKYANINLTGVAYIACLWMFSRCSSLSCLNVNFTQWSGYDAAGQFWPNTYYWVDGVAANGTFKKPSTLTSSRGSSYIPTNWNVVNK